MILAHQRHANHASLGTLCVHNTRDGLSSVASNSGCSSGEKDWKKYFTQRIEGVGQERKFIISSSMHCNKPTTQETDKKKEIGWGWQGSKEKEREGALYQ